MSKMYNSHYNFKNGHFATHLLTLTTGHTDGCEHTECNNFLSFKQNISYQNKKFLLNNKKVFT